MNANFVPWSKFSWIILESHERGFPTAPSLFYWSVIFNELKVDNEGVLYYESKMHAAFNSVIYLQSQPTLHLMDLLNDDCI